LRCYDTDEVTTTVDYSVFGTFDDMQHAFTSYREATDITNKGGACFTGESGEYAPLAPAVRTVPSVRSPATSGVATPRSAGRTGSIS
jgi:hypothetical protein